MQKILIPYDGSENGLRVVRYAASLAIKALRRAAGIAECAGAFAAESTRRLVRAADRALASRRVRHHSRAARQFSMPKKFNTKVRSRVGSPANEIALHVRETQCDAIIMGSVAESDSRLGDRFGRHQDIRSGRGPGDSDQVGAARSPGRFGVCFCAEQMTEPARPASTLLIGRRTCQSRSLRPPR